MPRLSRVANVPPSIGIMGRVIFAGLIGAAIDAIYFSVAASIKGGSPEGVLQSIASFWFGPASMGLGALSIVVGGATHVGLAILMALGFMLLDSRRDFLPTSALPAGLVYGAFLYVVMYYAVLPLRWPELYPRWDGWSSLLDIGVHIAMGVAFAVVLRRSYRLEGAASSGATLAAENVE